ncbi:DUF397 domain-containing protein [Streptomyces sp. NPDC052396]|uniref:DUF397 domain-containing protein n=1 Tax=Streptomyces sp. NPDC052396 TaxID=3365689 RepID=UPI0037D31DD1
MIPTPPPDLSGAAWRKSSYSNPDGGECVEVADDIPGAVPVRDSKRLQDPNAQPLIFPTPTWRTFTTSLTQGTLRSKARRL